MAEVPTDLSIIYITANVIPEKFAEVAQHLLLQAKGDARLISVSKKPMDFGDNVFVGDTPRSLVNIYRQALIGVKDAQTKYIAIAEDDVLYHEEHFKFRPKPGHWGYNMNSWNIYTWTPQFFSQKSGGRRNLNGLICERDMFIAHMEERFSLWPEEVNPDIWGEPGKYDNQLGTTPYPSQYFYPNPPNIVFSHEKNLQFAGLGKRKRVGEIRATEIPEWGTAKEVAKIYV
jgi:hypothetical protein